MQIKLIVERLIKKHNTNDPFTIAQNMNIIILYSDMKNTLGFFNTYKRSRFIHLNQNIPTRLKRFVCAHELGHAIQHQNINTPFLKRNTLFSVDKIEREANEFAVELLLTDDILKSYPDITLFHLAKLIGIPEKLTTLKSTSLQHLFKISSTSFYRS